MGRTSGGIAGRIAVMLLGGRTALPAAVLERFPELSRVAWRSGGVVPRAAALFMGSRGVSAVTLWRTVFLARGVQPSPALLLHELRHVEQFEESAAFPFAYLWEQLRRGYEHNRFEVDARRYAARRLTQATDSRPL